MKDKKILIWMVVMFLIVISSFAYGGSITTKPAPAAASGSTVAPATATAIAGGSLGSTGTAGGALIAGQPIDRDAWVYYSDNRWKAYSSQPSIDQITKDFGNGVQLNFYKTTMSGVRFISESVKTTKQIPALYGPGGQGISQTDNTISSMGYAAGTGTEEKKYSWTSEGITTSSQTISGKNYEIQTDASGKTISKKYGGVELGQGVSVNEKTGEVMVGDKSFKDNIIRANAFAVAAESAKDNGLVVSQYTDTSGNFLLQGRDGTIRSTSSPKTALSKDTMITEEKQYGEQLIIKKTYLIQENGKPSAVPSDASIQGKQIPISLLTQIESAARSAGDKAILKGDSLQSGYTIFSGETQLFSFKEEQQAGRTVYRAESSFVAGQATLVEKIGDEYYSQEKRRMIYSTVEVKDGKAQTKIISESKYNELVKEGQKPDAKAIPTYETITEGPKSSPTKITQIDYTFGFDKSKADTLFGEGRVYEANKDGRMEYKGFYYVDRSDGKDDVWITSDGSTWTKNGQQAAPPSDLAGKLESSRRATNMRSWLSTLEFSATTFRGLGVISRIFMSKEDLANWKKGVDDLFCNTILLGGIDCWTSEICGHAYDKSTAGVAYVETPSGMIEAAAHVEAERSRPMMDPLNQTKEYLYKITFYVRSNQEDVRFNAVLYGDRTVKLFSEDILLKAGEDSSNSTEARKEYSATGQNAIVQYSRSSYNKICLEFSQGDIKTICNKVVESDYSKDNYIKSRAAVSGAGSASSGGAETASINQI